jgi:hypothetical protein
VAAFGFASLGNVALNVGHHLELPRDNLQYCFHAMALDERRPSFLNTRLDGACEVWFRGVHSDVGGGNGNTPLNDITLKWMMCKAISAKLPIDSADVPVLKTGKLEPSHSNRLPFAIRLVRAIDRSHYSVAPLDGWTNPPSTCPRETEADEQKAAEVGDEGLEVMESLELRRRFLAMWETALAAAAAQGFTLDHVREPLLTLFEGRVPLVTDDGQLQQAGAAVRRLIQTAIDGARERGFNTLEEFFLTEALFKLPRLFPLTD